MAKKKRLPNNFEELLLINDLEVLKSVFDTCDLNARGGYAKATALAFDECSDELTRWLVEQGADILATDSWGDTPLHTRVRNYQGKPKILLELGADVHSCTAKLGTPLHAAASAYRVENAKLLLAYGARVDALNQDGLTSLELALRRCSNNNIQDLAALAALLLAAGAVKTASMQDDIVEIGKSFEFHRSNFNPEFLDAFSCALEQLYHLFDVQPVPSRVMHDKQLPITVKSVSWPEQHHELWEILVPSQGAAATVQGEVIRISGRIANELEGNGGINWDSDYKKMAEAFLVHIQSENSLASAEIAEAKSLIKDVKNKLGDTQRMAELAVTWVLLNPSPISLGTKTYKR